jgi:streptomycin 6-kinase
VLAAVGAEGDCVLKVPEADAEERQVVSALRAFALAGGVRVLRWNEETGAVLMPRMRPGNTLADANLDDLAAVDVCADLILRLREAAPEGGLPLEVWFSDWEVTGQSVAIEAKSIAEKLFATAPRPRLVHGDLHHFNILRSGEDWCAIDPKGIAADPAYEVAAFMRNPVPNVIAPEAMARRIERFAERLGDPPGRLWGWSFCQTALCFAQTDDEPFRSTWEAAMMSLASLRSRFWRC